MRCKGSRWDDLSCATRNLVQQCLHVEMRDRPAAMVLLLHPAFGGQSELSDGASVSADARRNSSAGSMCVFTPFAVVKGCGLLAVRPEQAKTSELQEAFSDRQVFARDWQERRYSRDALRRLATNLCVREPASPAGRTPGQPPLAEQEPEDPKAVEAAWKARRLMRRAARTYGGSKKYFTTHGAVASGSD